MKSVFRKNGIRIVLSIICTVVLCANTYTKVMGKEDESATNSDNAVQTAVDIENNSQNESQSAPQNEPQIVMETETESESESNSESESESESEKESESVTEPESQSEKEHQEETATEEAEDETETEAETETESESESESQATTEAVTQAPGEIHVSELLFEKEYKEENDWKLTNGMVEIRFEVVNVENVSQIYYMVNGEILHDVVFQNNQGSILLEQDMLGEIVIYCVDEAGRTISVKVGNFWIDRIPPVITAGDVTGTISLMPGVALNITAAEVENIIKGSGLAAIQYQLDGEHFEVPIEDGGFTLTFEQAGTHELVIVALDRAGNMMSINRTIEVKNAPIISVTLPTTVEVVVLSDPIANGINLFSEPFDVVNKSNVPIRVSLSRYEMLSGYTGGFGNSYLYLDMVRGGENVSLPLGFLPLSNVCEFNLAPSQYSAENVYVSSGNESIANCTYRGFADAEFNEYLRHNKVEFNLVFVFEALEEE